MIANFTDKELQYLLSKIHNIYRKILAILHEKYLNTYEEKLC